MKLESEVSKSIHAYSLLEAVINAIPAPVFYKDKEGRYLGCNDAFVEFVGRPREELIGKGVFELWEPALAEIYHKADQALLDAGGKQIYEGRVTYADGSVRDVMFHKAVFFAEQESLCGMVGVMLDITERKRLERSLDESRNLFTQAFHANPSLIALSDPTTGRLVDVNKAWLQGLKFTREEAIGKTVYELGVWVNLDDREELLKLLGESGCVRDFDAQLRARDGSILSCLIEIDKITSGEKELVLWTASDISKRKEAERVLQEMARTDALTRLANRHALYEVMDRACKRAKRHEKEMAVLVLDLDGFKQVNDVYGHLVGDEMLIEIAKRLQHSVRETDLVARLGGDEFAIILEDVKCPEDINDIAGHIVERIKGNYIIQGHSCAVGISIGVSIYGVDGTEPDELILKADKALYQMKAKGKGSYIFYSE